MRYLLLIGSENKTAAPPSPAEGQAMVQAFMRFSEEVRAAGKTVVSERLRPEDEASRVRVKAGQRQVMDGPFAETKEVLGGFYLLECASKEEALPEGDELAARLPAVLSVVYLIFNEGYAAHTGAALVRDDLCAEAIRLGGMLAELMPDEAEALGLLALMELQASRAAARADADGNLVLLANQDRARWDRARIARGLAWLPPAGPLEHGGPYPLHAAISACA